MEVLLAGGEGVGEKGWMDRWFVHGGGGGGQRSCDWWSSLLCGDCGFVFGELEWGESVTRDAEVKMAEGGWVRGWSGSRSLMIEVRFAWGFWRALS